MPSHGATHTWKKKKEFLEAIRGATASRPTVACSRSSSTIASSRASLRAESRPRTCFIRAPGDFEMRLLLLLLLCVATAAHAQDFPNKTIRIFIPFQAGGLLDVVAHVVADKFREKWNQPAVPEHRVGA